MELVFRNQVLFNVEVYESVLVAYLRADRPRDCGKTFSSMVMSVATADVEGEVQEGTLHHFHALLGHLAYDAVERLARDPRSGIRITDYSRPNCLTCAEGKGHKTKHPKEDSGGNAPIDRVGG